MAEKFVARYHQLIMNIKPAAYNEAYNSTSAAHRRKM